MRLRVRPVAEPRSPGKRQPAAATGNPRAVRRSLALGQRHVSPGDPPDAPQAFYARVPNHGAITLLLYLATLCGFLMPSTDGGRSKNSRDDSPKKVREEPQMKSQVF